MPPTTSEQKIRGGWKTRLAWSNIRGGWSPPFGTKNKRGMENQARLTQHIKGGMDFTLRNSLTIPPPLLIDDGEYVDDMLEANFMKFGTRLSELQDAQPP